MIYRENGQFKSSYRADQQIFPIRQDRYVVLGLLLVAFLLVPAMASNYFLQAILIPFLILSLAAIGLNILVGYCGQISIGSGAFMAVGAYAAWNFGVRIPELPLVLQILLGGVFATLVGVAFGIPSLRIVACTWPSRPWPRSSLWIGLSCVLPSSRTTRPRATCRCLP